MIRRRIPLRVWIVPAPTGLLAQDEERGASDLIAHQRFAGARALDARLPEKDPRNLDYEIRIARLSAWLHEYSQAIDGHDQVLQRDPHMWQQRFSEAGDTRPNGAHETGFGVNFTVRK